MINITKIENSDPYNKFVELYEHALRNNQSQPEAMVISSFDASSQEVDSRFVNLKYVIKNEWTFFSNYNSPKSDQFKSHDQISCVFYWDKIDTQIRLKAKITFADSDLSNAHFNERSKEKNALAISSKQSKKISSYEKVLLNYEDVFEDINNIKKRPEYWGGFTFVPFYFEFWQGHESRINKRQSYISNKSKDKDWIKSVLQP
tara:strand:- start:409 stop:1017 length:609 start_codon:yes stop_codon:yes gene_type:complete